MIVDAILGWSLYAPPGAKNYLNSSVSARCANRVCVHNAVITNENEVLEVNHFLQLNIAFDKVRLRSYQSLITETNYSVAKQHSAIHSSEIHPHSMQLVWHCDCTLARR